MAQYITEIAVGRWANRANLNYVPCNEPIGGVRFNAFGVRIGQARDPGDTRRPYRMEEAGTTTYVMYDSDGSADVPIYRTREV